MDKETRLACVRYAGDDFDKAQIVRETILSESYRAEWTLDEFRAILDSVPAEYAESARVEYERGCYDSGDSLLVYYYRPETKQEVAERVARCVQYAHESMETERQTYEALKAKFGHNSPA